MPGDSIYSILSSSLKPNCISLLFSFELCKPQPHKQPTQSHSHTLLFSFELCMPTDTASMAISGYISTSGLLAIFFWIMPSPLWRENIVQNNIDNLLFSFELCSHGEFTIIATASETILLFSFELCSLVLYCSSSVLLRCSTCYFLLNYAAYSRGCTARSR